MATVKQPTNNPTNKLTAAVVGVAVVEVIRVFLANTFPGWADPSMWAALTPIVVFACGWFVKDRPNVQR